MTTEEIIKWAGGAYVAASVGAFWKIWGRFSDTEKRISAATAALHDRIDKVKDDYVRRDDFTLMRAEMKDDMKAVNEKLDRLIARMDRPSP